MNVDKKERIFIKLPQTIFFNKRLKSQKSVLLKNDSKLDNKEG
jgi:hypothetical protein